MARRGEQPDVVIGCVGGGSNFGGLTFPFVAAVCAARRRRASSPPSRRLPDPHPRALPLRLRRHGRADAADADVHARPRVCAAAGARRRAALPRRLADPVRLVRAGHRRGARLPAERDVRGRRALRAHARASSPRPSRRTRSARSSRRPRPPEAGEARVILFGLCGHGHFDLERLRRLPRRRARGPRVLRARNERRARAAARGAGDRVIAAAPNARGARAHRGRERRLAQPNVPGRGIIAGYSLRFWAARRGDRRRRRARRRGADRAAARVAAPRLGLQLAALPDAVERDVLGRSACSCC